MNKFILGILMAFCVPVFAGNDVFTVSCTGNPTRLHYKLTLSEEITSISFEGTPLKELKQSFTPVYQENRFLYNKWIFSGRYTHGSEDQLIRGDYIEVARKGRLYRSFSRNLAVAHYDYASGQALASSTSDCKKIR